jgi:Spy/CpxP family protein refolding chaperone
MKLKKIAFFLAVVFAVSAISSTATWLAVTKRQEIQVSWKETLNLTPEQEAKFASLEAEFSQALKEMEMEDARNKVTLCSYLGRNEKNTDIMSTARRMAQAYQIKQEKIAMTLVSISEILTPEQKQLFTNRLMHEVCVSCRKTTGTEKCLCGMCDHHS